ncbi:CLUMA_CG000860, isoform A [Clunio marinus]|uniref:CLUMA_CG000860, isoform A n=1 Tax=Clunio marinus TaxID=568069 RepID=A0A1J1HGB8_9DIPT|nr:CLUMA_CG000860, isoform A [Clunio marinus]
MTESESSFNLTCFDDDFDKHTEEINEYYEYLETHDFIELNWKCPGRKTPQKAEDIPKVETPTKELQHSKNMEFDFEDELPEPSTTKFGTPNRTPKATSASKKKTTTFSQIMDKMKKSHGTPK